MSREIRSVAICGAGAMGTGIAQVAAQAGAAVTVFDTQAAALDAGRSRIAADLAFLVKRGKMDDTDAAAIASRIAWTPDLSDLREADLVIEAIIEREDAKTDLFRNLETVLDADAIIATNTSSLPIYRLAESIAHPERFIGMHFFNPAPVMKLVEIVGGIQTAPAVEQAVIAAAKMWGKAAIPVADVPGFIVNRVARPFYAEAFRALGEDSGSPQLIDHLFRAAAGFRMGPLELTDLIGQDVNYSVARSVYDAYDGKTRFVPQPAQAALVESGQLGRKSGSGVYDYADGSASKPNDAPTPRPIDAELPVVKEGRAAFARLIDGLRGRAPHGFACVGDVLVGFTEGRSAGSEASRTGRDVALFDWINDAATAPLAFSASSEPAAAAAAAFARSAGRTSFRIGDRPGLVLLRTLCQLANTAADAAADQVADENGIDIAMRYGANYPFGLFAWADDFGRARVAEVLANIAAETGEPLYAPSAYFERAE